MALPVIPIPLPQQSINPFASSLDLLNSAIKGSIVNQYLPQSLQASLTQQNLQNQMMQPKVQYAPQFAQAELAQAQAQPAYTRAQTQGILQGTIPEQQALAALYGINTKKAAALLPYDVQKGQAGVFTDPVLSKLFQLSLANNTGEIPSQYLSSIGLPTTPQELNNYGAPTNQQVNNQAAPGMPNLGNVISNGIRNVGNNPYQPQATLNVQKNSPITNTSQYTGTPLQNFAYFGSTVDPFLLKQMQAQAEETGKSNVQNWNETFKDAQKDVSNMNSMINNLNQFKSNYAQSYYKGTALGRIPSSGLETALIPGNLGVERSADNAANQLAADVGKTKLGGQITNQKLKFLMSLKPSRDMTPETVQTISDSLMMFARRGQELPQFMNAAYNMGIDSKTAQTLWDEYNVQRPLFDYYNNTPYTQFQGSWQDFLTPDAIQSAKSGKQFVSIPKFNTPQQLLNWRENLPQNQKDYVKSIMIGANKNAS